MTIEERLFNIKANKIVITEDPQSKTGIYFYVYNSATPFTKSETILEAIENAENGKWGNNV